MKRFFLLSTAAALAACDGGSHGDDFYDCAQPVGALPACPSGMAASGLEEIAAIHERIGVDRSPGSGPALIVAIGEDSIELRDDEDQPFTFRWPGPLPEGFAVGEEVTFERNWRWESLRSATFGLATLEAAGYSPDGSAQEPPGGGPLLRWEFPCDTGAGAAVALHLDWFGDTRIVHPGETATLGAWTFENLGGLSVPDRSGQPGNSTSCMTRAGMAAPMLFAVAGTAVWQADPEAEWCAADLVARNDRLLEERAFPDLGIRVDVGVEAEQLPGTIDRVEAETVHVRFGERGEARFVWPAQLPAGLQAGDEVTLLRRGNWHELHGPVDLALLAEQNFTATDELQPAFGRIPLAWAPVCAFPENDSTACGPARGYAAVFGVELPDGSLLAPGESAVVGATTLENLGALQLPSHGNDACVVEAWFQGLVTAVGPAER